MRENNRKCCLSLKGEKKGGDGGMCVEAVFVVSHARTAHHESTCMHGKQFFSSAHLQQVKKKKIITIWYDAVFTKRCTN